MTDFSESQKQYMDNLFTKLSNDFTSKTAQVKKEIFAKIEEVKTEIHGVIHENQRKIHGLEEENKRIRKNITQLERKVRKNNLVVFGLNSEENNLLKDFTNLSNNILEVSVHDTDINDIYKVGTSGNVKVVEFVSFKKKIDVLKHAKKLKGSNVIITNDLSWEDRVNQKILIKHMRESRAKGLKSYIKGNKLVIGEDIYTAEDLESKSIGAESDLEVVRAGKGLPTTNQYIWQTHETEELGLEEKNQLEQELGSKKGRITPLTGPIKLKEVEGTRKPLTRAYTNTTKHITKNN